MNLNTLTLEQEHLWNFNMKKHLLFCCEKWCAGTPHMGLTNSFHNLFNSFSQVRDDYIYNTLHLDESYLIYEKGIDDTLIKYCINFKPEIVIFCLLGGSNLNPHINTYYKLKNMGIKLCFMWPDTNKWAIDIILNLKDVIDLSISWDNPVSTLHTNTVFPTNHKFMWTPEDGNLFYNDIKDIDVSFVGSTNYPDRNNILSTLLIKRHIYIDGGQRNRQLTPDKYAKIIRSSKICINFSKSPCQTYYQTKGRVFETLSSKGLLLESKNQSTSKFFTPGIDYVEFEDAEDLCQKIDYYLNNEKERINIATNGYLKYHEYYSSQIFWNKILEKLK